MTIIPEELEDAYCPECYEAKGIKNSSFEEISTPGDGKTRYRCEECNAVIDAD